MLKLTRIAGLMTLLLLPGRGIPLGLGEIELHSALNEPLDADIGVLDVGKMPLHDIVASLASASEFDRLGIDRPFFLTHLQMDVVKDPNGQPVIHLSSQQPIREPFIDMLVSLAWPEGRMVREYTLLLDPPVLTEESPPPVVAPEVAPAMTAGKSAEGPVTKRVDETTHPAVAEAGSQGLRYGPVKRTDTLWSVAEKMRGDRSLTIPQVMLALLHENPAAFYHGNVNELKAGYVLRISNTEDMAAIPPADAEREVRRQYREWLQTKGRHVRQPAKIGDQEGAALQQAEITPGVQTPTPERPHLKLMAPVAAGSVGKSTGQDTANEAATPAAAGSADISQQLLGAIEAADVAQRENQALRERLALLEKQIVDLQRLITLKGDAMASLQAAAASAESTAETTPLGAQTPATTSEAGEDAAMQTTPDAVTGNGQLPSSPPVQATNEPRPATLGFIDELLQPLWLGMAGLGLALVLIALQVVRRRRDRASGRSDVEIESPSEASLGDAGSDDASAGAVEEEDVTAAALLDAVKAGSQTESQDISSPFDDENEEIDTISEADVYLAYRRFDKAEQLLLDALRSEPERRDLVLKLLETYAMSENTEAFVLRAEALQTVLGKEERETVWGRVRELGIPLLGSEHPLFASETTSKAEQTVAVSEAQEAGTPAAVAEEAQEEDGVIEGRERSQSDLDVPLEFTIPDIEGMTPDREPAGDVVTRPDGGPEEGEQNDQVNDVLPAGVAGVSEDDLSWLNEMVEEDLGDLLVDEGRVQTEDTNTEPGEETGMAVNGADEIAGKADEIAGEDSVATQLDLARAFIDMGDVGSAREILERLDAVTDAEQNEAVKILLRQIA